ncbi:MAG: type I restriction enzyme HsdR N-terminal domain-containing protein [Halobellus sp.]|uniref:type I restriction enzyme HsdR N-terminal domain-containing protein n=1 Tax=Halobellus sp. TaxID=1979212 RepID=UPI0035D4AF39
MDGEAVRNYVGQSQTLLEASPQMDEENTKVKLIQPFVDLLGWNFYSTEVQLEYTVQMGTQSSKVDYALMVGDTPVVFIEAKPARSDLTESNVRQLQSYMRQELSVDWGVLTNGKDFEILSVTGDDSQDGETSIATFDLDEMAENPDILEILTKDAIQSGRADDIARQLTQTSRAIRRLSNREESIAGRLAEVLRDELGEIPLDFEEQSLDYVHDLQHALRERREFIGESTTDDGDTSGDDISEDDPDTGEVNIEPTDNTVAGTIGRTDIEGDEDAQVAVFPTRESGLTFLSENNAWGFVRVGRDFDYVAMYVTQNAREVQYFAKVRDVVVPEDAELTREPTAYVDRSKIADNKMVVRFEADSLYQLEDPIPYETKYPQSLRYTTLGEFRTAETTDDIL